MPRVARLDAPGLLHHVMIRGIKRRRIFNDNEDRENLIERLSMLLPKTGQWGEKTAKEEDYQTELLKFWILRSSPFSKEKYFLVNGLWFATMEGEPLPERTYNHVALKVNDADFGKYEECSILGS